MSIVEICPQRLHSFRWENDLSPLLEEIKNLEFGINENNLISRKMNVLSSSSFKDLREWIKECLTEVKVKEGIWGDKLVLTQSWVNRSSKGQWHHRHVHPNSVVSGIFALSPSESCTWFSVNDIWKESGHDLSGYCYPQFRREVIHKEPTSPGKLILFPSSLPHSVCCHTFDEPRYSISFNTFPEGSYGDETGNLQIKVLNSFS